MASRIRITEIADIAPLIDTEKNRLKGIAYQDLAVRSKTEIYWKCENGHTFKEKVNVVYRRKNKCHYCSGRKVLSGENDLETLYPSIAKEWDVEKNEGVLPRDVSPYSYNSYYWICPKGHSYKKKVIKRTKEHKPVDCPKCIKAHSTSFPEQAIYFYAKKCFPNAINRYKEPFEKGMELDIFIPDYNLGIEYDGIAFHNDEEQHKREVRKYLACKELGIKLVRIKETKETWKDTADEIFYVKKRMRDSETTSFLRFLFGSLFMFNAYLFRGDSPEEKFLNRYYGFPTDFDVSKDRKEILEYLVDVEHSLGMKYPQYVEMWDEDGNGKLTPFMFTPGSNYNAVWRCPDCCETWNSPIASIVSRKVKRCKKCSMRENGKMITRVKTYKSGSLADRSELLLRQWDYEENGTLSPYDIPLNYSKKVAWKCDECGYKWKSSPNTRVRVNKIAGCPHCTGRVAMAGVDDLETLYPAIAAEWDYERNEGIRPSDIRPFTNKKYFWICPDCGNSYKTYPGSRVNGHGCPECARSKISKKKSKKVGQFDENGVLLNTFSSLDHAAKAMGVAKNSIFQAVKNGGRSKGYRWRYLDDIED